MKQAKEKPQTSAHLFAWPQHHGAFVVFQLVKRSRTFPQDDRPFKRFVNTCRCTWRFNCGVSPNVSRVGDLSGCSETCRSLGASPAEQDGQWPAPGPLSRAQLRASRQTNGNDVIRPGLSKYTQYWLWSNIDFWISLPGHMKYIHKQGVLFQPSHFNVIKMCRGWNKWKSEELGPEFLEPQSWVRKVIYNN